MYSLLFLSLLFFFFVWVAISYQLQKPKHRIWMNVVHLSMIAWNLATCRWASLLWTSKCIFAMHSLVKNVYWFFAGIRWHSLLLLPLLFLFSWMFILAAISYQLQEYTHRIWVNMVHLSVNLAIRGGSFCSSQIAFLNVKSC